MAPAPVQLAPLFHFGVNTFTDSERGSGHESPSIFNPERSNASQWMDAAQSAGAQLVILTVNHHDGFCLWPSAYTNFSVASVRREGGCGSVDWTWMWLLPLAMGFARELLWRHSSLQRVLLGSAPRASYWFSSLAADALTRHFVSACRYGPISEVWLDGAKSPTAVNMSYDFELWFDTIHPRCQHLFRRWPRHPMGWERVWRGRTTMLGDGEQIFHYDRQERWPVLDVWRECWNRLAPSGVRYLHQARNCLLLLNVPPNSSGLIDESDFQTLERSSFGPKQILDECMETFWAPMQGESTGWIELDLGKVSKFNTLEIREPVNMGQRVMEYLVEACDSELGWYLVSNGSTIGYRKVDRLKEDQVCAARSFDC
ncbi:hypothetical protein SELMODRAFT_431823 [Selaginella moellendorffii]|uniref:alpha-L-fucosidase n=1 Tax=Selaginella moellendorffii TaxID=88036 RepID=D8TDX6_SELML|nr:hypothetical protein SELMODRAFT_431823 [Selaginella moellendorffii]